MIHHHPLRFTPGWFFLRQAQLSSILLCFVLLFSHVFPFSVFLPTFHLNTQTSPFPSILFPTMFCSSVLSCLLSLHFCPLIPNSALSCISEKESRKPLLHFVKILPYVLLLEWESECLIHLEQAEIKRVVDLRYELIGNWTRLIII